MLITIEHRGIKRTIDGGFQIRGYHTDIDRLVTALQAAKKDGLGFIYVIVPDEHRPAESVQLAWVEDVPRKSE